MHKILFLEGLSPLRDKNFDKFSTKKAHTYTNGK